MSKTDHTPKAEQLHQLTLHSLRGVFIGCNSCNAYDIVEDFPDDAPIIFYDKGWRYLKDKTACPDCVRSQSLIPK